MSAATASSTELMTIYVRLLNEGVDVWRPVRARRLGDATYEIATDPVPEGKAFPAAGSIRWRWCARYCRVRP